MQLKVLLTVQARHITLYGMEKSGVGRLTKRDSVYNCNKIIESSFKKCTFEEPVVVPPSSNECLSNRFELKKFCT